MQTEIFIKGARENNLKNIDVTIPRDKLVVLTGLSGSGKSSLAFDTIYAEGQRRYVESLSSYARMFLGQMDKPDVDYIEGLSPAISIDQKTTSKNPRSTVGTVTEIYDYLRLLRQGDPPPDGGSDHRPDTGPARGHPYPGDGPGGARPQGRARQGAGGCPPVRLRPGPGGRQYVRTLRGHLSGEEPQAPHRHRGGPTDRPPGHRRPADRLSGDGLQPGEWPRHR